MLGTVAAQTPQHSNFVVLMANRDLTAFPKSSSSVALRNVFATGYNASAQVEFNNIPSLIFTLTHSGTSLCALRKVQAGL